MLQNIKHNKVIHKNNIVISVVTSQFPKVPDDQRLVVEKIATSPCRVTRIYAHYGYMESPDVPHVIAMAKARGLDVDHKTVSYFIGHRTLVGHPDRGLPVWQEKIFIAMSKSATSPTDFYRLPVSRVVEMGVQISL